MAVKLLDVPGIGTVKAYKRRASRTMRLSITARGEVRVTLPFWVPYAAAKSFVASKQSWVREQLDVRPAALRHQQPIGKLHTLEFAPSPGQTTVSARARGNFIRVQFPAVLAVDDPEVQQAAARAAIRALRAEAESILPNRLAAMASQYGFTYSSVGVKRLTGRWGSCDQDRNIVLNLFLMQLPWSLVDYVLLHELTHTQIMRHGPDFWRAMGRYMPDTQLRRQTIKDHRPVIGA